VKAADLQIRGLRPSDTATLKSFTCSTGEPWEEVVEEQIQGPLPLRYLDTPPYFDGRMLLGFDKDGGLLAVGAHHIEPGLSPDVGYTEVVAVALDARGVLVELPGGGPISLRAEGRASGPAGGSHSALGRAAVGLTGSRRGCLRTSCPGASVCSCRMAAGLDELIFSEGSPQCLCGFVVGQWL
jgi:hypothetical protein